MTLQNLIDAAQQNNISLDTPLCFFDGETQSYTLMNDHWEGRYKEEEGIGIVTAAKLSELDKELGYTENDLFSTEESTGVIVIGTV